MDMKKIIFLLVLVISLGSFTSFKKSWMYIGSARDGDKWYVNSSCDSKNGSGNDKYIKTWVKTEFRKRTLKKNGKTLTYTNVHQLELVEVNCKNRQIKYITTALYDAQGKVIDMWSWNENELAWINVVPGSMAEAVMIAVSERFN